MLRSNRIVQTSIDVPAAIVKPHRFLAGNRQAEGSRKCRTHQQRSPAMRARTKTGNQYRRKYDCADVQDEEIRSTTDVPAFCPLSALPPSLLAVFDAPSPGFGLRGVALAGAGLIGLGLLGVSLPGVGALTAPLVSTRPGLLISRERSE